MEITVEEIMIEKVIDDEIEFIPNLIDKYVRRIVEERDELIYSLFEKCGYSRDEVLDLIKAEVITGTKASSVVYPDMEWYSFSANGETLFVVNEVFDPETYTVTLRYQMAKGESDE